MKNLAVTPARYDVDFWTRCCFLWTRWLKAPKRRPTINPAHRSRTNRAAMPRS